MKLNIEKENQDKSGIYIIRNSINHKIYIGSAVNLRRRFYGHISAINNNQHDNPLLQRFSNKYGIDKLSFNLIEVVENKENLLKREQFYLDLFKSYDRNAGFNICKVAGSTLGITMPESHRLATKNRTKGKKYRLGQKATQETIEKNRIISKNMWAQNYDKMYEACLKSAEKRKGKPIWNENMPHPNLGKPSKCRGQKRSPEFCEKMRIRALTNNAMKGRHLSDKHKEAISKFHSKKVIQIDSSGNFIKEFYSQDEAEKELNLYKGSVSRVCNKEYKHTRGFYLKWKD